MHVSWAGSHWHLAGRSWVNCQTSFKYKEFSGPKCLSAEPEKLFNPPNNSLKKLSHWAINLPKESAANTMLNYTMTTVQSNKQVELNISDIKYMCVFFFFPLAHLSALESNSILTLPGVNANITSERLSSQECVPFWTPYTSLGLLNQPVWEFPRSPPQVLWFAELTHKTQKSTLPTTTSLF